jgi:hypothetical protein
MHISCRKVVAEMMLCLPASRFFLAALGSSIKAADITDVQAGRVKPCTRLTVSSSCMYYIRINISNIHNIAK